MGTQGIAVILPLASADHVECPEGTWDPLGEDIPVGDEHSRACIEVEEPDPNDEPFFGAACLEADGSLMWLAECDATVRQVGDEVLLIINDEGDEEEINIDEFEELVVVSPNGLGRTPGLLVLQSVLTSGCWKLAGDGETENIWTPVLGVNSPFGGSASATIGSSSSWGMSLGGLGISLSGSEAVGESKTLSVENGASSVLFMDYLWKYVHRTCWTDTGGRYLLDFWYISDTSPSGAEIPKTENITANPTTDADNVVKPLPDGFAYDMRLHEPAGEPLCTGAGSGALTMTDTYSYSVGVEFEFQYKGAMVGTSSTSTSHSANKVTFPEGNCWQVNNGGLKRAYNWVGPDSGIHPEAGSVSITGRDHGCDAPDDIEDALGRPIDIGTYRYAGTAKGVTKVEMDGEQANSRAYEINAHSSHFEQARVKGDGTFEARTAVTDQTNYDDLWVDVDMDYEIPEDFLDQQFNVLPTCSEINNDLSLPVDGVSGGIVAADPGCAVQPDPRSVVSVCDTFRATLTPHYLNNGFDGAWGFKFVRVYAVVA